MTRSTGRSGGAGYPQHAPAGPAWGLFRRLRPLFPPDWPDHPPCGFASDSRDVRPAGPSCAASTPTRFWGCLGARPAHGPVPFGMRSVLPHAAEPVGPVTYGAGQIAILRGPLADLVMLLVLPLHLTAQTGACSPVVANAMICCATTRIWRSRASTPCGWPRTPRPGPIPLTHRPVGRQKVERQTWLAGAEGTAWTLPLAPAPAPTTPVVYVAMTQHDYRNMKTPLQFQEVAG